MNITNYLPVIIRYAIVSLAGAMFARGWLSSDQNAVLSQNADLIVSSIVGLGTVAYALFKRPSQKALDAAKAIDKQLLKDDPVVIKTPGAQPDIVVQPN